MSLDCIACSAALSTLRPYLRCLTCHSYHSCSDCQLLERFVGGHSAFCFYEVWLNGEVFVVKDGVESRRVRDLPPVSSSAGTTPAWSLPGSNIAGNSMPASGKVFSHFESLLFPCAGVDRSVGLRQDLRSDIHIECITISANVCFAIGLASMKTYG